MVDVIHICVAMKPIEGGFAQNALKYGVAGINIDGCRIELEENDRLNKGGSYSGNRTGSNEDGWFTQANSKIEYSNPPGRFPSNVILDGSEEVMKAFPVTGGGNYGDQDSASRYFKVVSDE